MNTIHKLTTACLLLLFASAAAPIQAAEPLTWKWTEGDTTRYLMTQSMQMTIMPAPGQEFKTKSLQKMLMTWNVGGQDEQGATKIDQSLDRIVMSSDGPMGQSFDYDSQDEEAPAGMAAMVAPMFDAMVKDGFTISMLPNGKIVDVQLSEGLAEAFKRLPGGSMSADMVTQMSQNGSLVFPDRELSPGDNWTQETGVNTPQIGKMTVTTTYTYNGTEQVDGRELESFTPQIEIGTGDSAPTAAGMPKLDFSTRGSSGKLLFDRETGRLVSSELNQEMEINVTVGEKSFTNVMEQTVAMRELKAGEEPEFDEDPESGPVSAPVSASEE